MKSYRDLEVYQRSYKLAVEIHNFSMKLPKELSWDLGDQIRRASRSIPSNIAEGYGRSKSWRDIVNFLNDALGSNHEMLFNLEFMKDVGLIKEHDYKYYVDQYTICGKQLFTLIKVIKTSN